MLLFPQLLSGAVAQFPLKRTFSVSNVNNIQEDGSRYQGTGVDPAWVTWKLAYQGLSLLESEVLKTFFQAARGRLLAFIFLDPMGNLLAWSEDLSKPVWEKTALLSVTVTDSARGKVSQLSNAGAGVAKIPILKLTRKCVCVL